MLGISFVFLTLLTNSLMGWWLVGNEWVGGKRITFLPFLPPKDILIGFQCMLVWKDLGKDVGFTGSLRIWLCQKFINYLMRLSEGIVYRTLPSCDTCVRPFSRERKGDVAPVCWWEGIVINFSPVSLMAFIRFKCLLPLPPPSNPFQISQTP